MGNTNKKDYTEIKSQELHNLDVCKYCSSACCNTSNKIRNKYWLCDLCMEKRTAIFDYDYDSKYINPGYNLWFMYADGDHKHSLPLLKDITDDMINDRGCLKLSKRNILYLYENDNVKWTISKTHTNVWVKSHTRERTIVIVPVD